MTSLHLGDVAPDFTAMTTDGEISFHDWKKGSWAVFFSHPADFTPVCTTELGRTAALKSEFAARRVTTIEDTDKPSTYPSRKPLALAEAGKWIT